MVLHLGNPISLLGLMIIGIIEILSGLINVVFPLDRVGQLTLALFGGLENCQVVIHVAVQ